jgi:2-methylcitrate dehydratase PrpD
MLNDLAPLDPFLNCKNNLTVPAHSLEVMELCLLDWAICGLGADNNPISLGMAQYSLNAGAGSASIFNAPTANESMWSGRVPARTAALINGTISHALDFDDTHFGHIGHVSTVVIPAALAVAETEGADFDAFLRAARIGAEVATRVGLWLGRSHYQAGWHQTATSGAFGAASAAAILMDAPPTSTILNVAGFASGQKAQFGSAMKPVNAGMAAAHGVEAAQLAKVGMCGSPDVIAALLATHHAEGNVSAFVGLGETWIFDSVSHKYHACCHGTHAMIEALLSLMPLNVDTIDRITVRTHPRWMSVCNKPSPTSWLEGKFSYRFLTALFLDGSRTIEPEPEAYFPLSQATQAMMARVNVVADDNVPETASEVIVSLSTGETLRASHDLAEPEPLSLRREKLMKKGADLLSPGVAQDVADAIAARNLSALTRALRRAN